MRSRGGRAGILVVSVFFSFCAAGPCGEDVVEATLGQPFKLKAGQAASIRSEKITLTFVAVLEDSRCPKGEQCIVAGNARVLIEVATGSNAPERIELNLGRGDSEAAVGNLEVTLLDLEPYPVSGRPVRAEDYLASLSLRRL